MFGDKFNLGNIGSLIKNAKKMQTMLEDAQSELAKIIVTGEAGGGMVKVQMTAKHQIINLEVDDEILKEDKSVFLDLLTAAINNASGKADVETKAKMMNFGDMLGIKDEEN